MIPVTKTYLPSLEEYNNKIKEIFERGYFTNQGPVLKELEHSIEEYLNIKNFHYVSNGTVAIQLALNALNITEGEIITTPFSFVATLTTVLWERCTPVFVDIDSKTLCIDYKKIEEKITPNTRAILAVHVFGYPSNVEKIEEIAKKHNISVIYDGAHAFGSFYKGKSLLSYGDISTCSFHATKLFHTVEGGACIVNNDKYNEKLELIKRFGFDKENYVYYGINAKNSEIHAAMGTLVLKDIDHIIEERKKVCELYDELLLNKIERPITPEDFSYNYAYYPAIFKSEDELLDVISALNEKDIFPRRYFWPSLNTLSYLENKTSCPISEDISSRIMCLPLYVGIKKEEIETIANIINETLKRR